MVKELVIDIDTSLLKKNFNRTGVIYYMDNTAKVEFFKNKNEKIRMIIDEINNIIDNIQIMKENYSLSAFHHRRVLEYFKK